MQFTILLVALIAIIGLVYGQAPEDVVQGVVELTPNNFDDVVNGDKYVLVEFYAPWCGHCKHLAPEFKKLGAAVAGNARAAAEIVIAKVNADSHRDIGGRFGVKGFPTLKWFKKGSTEAEDYNGGRTSDDFLQFLTEKTGHRLAAVAAPSDVVVLTEANFDSIVMDSDKDVLVEFYAPWCGHCKKLAPEYDIAGTAFANEKNVVIAKMDADKFKVVPGRYGVTGFPTLKFFAAGADKDAVAYNGARDANGIVDFMNEKAGTFRGVDGALNDNAGRSAALDKIAKNFVASSDRESLIAKAEKLEGSRYYVKVMGKIVAKGDEYVSKESARLGRILAKASASADRLDNMKTRVNVLSQF